MTTFSGSVDVIGTVPPGTVFDPEHPGLPIRIRLDGDTADISAGGNGVDGDLKLRTGPGQISLHLDGNSATLFLGGSGQGGDIFLFRSSGTNINDVRQASIHIDGEAGDIKLLNADFAEDFGFDVLDSRAADPGTVMVMGEDSGQLQVSTQPYDRRAAGVVSGARGFAPAIILDHRAAGVDNRCAIALAGKVYCKVDASYSPVEIGDMLTTSATPGHAMTATDQSRAFGSVIGKALEPLSTGSGLIQMLVALQ